jgi:hypothetical protein
MLSLGLSVGCQENKGCNEKIIDVEKGYNLQINVSLDLSINDDLLKYRHVKEQRVNFRQKNEILQSKIIANIFPDRIVTSIDVLKFKSKYYYRFEFFKSNGSSVIYRIYNLNGDVIKKNDSIDVFKDTHFEIIKNYDLTSLYIREND